jgi:hypothetical protein
LTRHLDKEQPVYGLVTDIARADHPRVEVLAAWYVAEVRAVQPEGPYFLGGLSFGGISCDVSSARPQIDMSCAAIRAGPRFSFFPSAMV